MTIVHIAFAIASALFFVGVYLDASSSSGQKEKTRIFRDAAGRFSLKRYLAVMFGGYAALTIAAAVADSTPIWLVASGVLVAGFVLRVRIAAKNRALRKAAGK